MVTADRARRDGASPIAKAAVGLAIVAGAALAGWATFFGDPSGGEPVAIVGIPPENDVAVEPGELSMRDTVPADAAIPGADDAPVDIGPATIRIIDPSGGTPMDDGPVELARAPFPGLAESSEYGLLPRVGEGGRAPFEAYARPAPPAATGPGAPVRVALVVTGLGISADGTRNALNVLPGAVSLAFAPYGSDLQTWVDHARSGGHEIFLQVPMEPFDYPDNDPGPHTLLTSLDAGDNVDRLRWALGRIVGYVGITNYMGAKLTSSSKSLRPIMSEIAARGLSFLDDGTSSRSVGAELAQELGTRAAVADISIAADAPHGEVIEALKQLEAIASERGQALGVTPALPVTIESVADWAAGLRERGAVLVPASALVNHQTS